VAEAVMVVEGGARLAGAADRRSGASVALGF
jgi:hypothetical protein